MLRFTLILAFMCSFVNAQVCRWTFHPDPPVAGQSLEICYDFGGIPNSPAKTHGTVTQDTPGGLIAMDFELNRVPGSTSGCITITLNSTTTEVSVHDKDFGSADLFGIVASPSPVNMSALHNFIMQ